VYPAAFRAVEMAAPMPREPPVTKAIFDMFPPPEGCFLKPCYR
jgi:hypothetical protein